MNYNKLVKLYPDYIETYRSKIKTSYVSTFINLLWCLLNMIQINTAQIDEISIFVVYHVTVNQWWRYPYSLGPEVESRTQGSRPRTQKNLRPRTALPRTNPLEAKDRNARGQGERHNAEVIFKKKKQRFLLQNFVNFPENLGVLRKKVFEAQWRSSRLNKIGHDHRVARIFDWGGGKPKIACYDVIRNFEKGSFCGGKDIVKWKIRSRGLVLARS